MSSSTPTNALQSIINRERYRLELDAHILALDDYEREAKTYTKAASHHLALVKLYHLVTSEYSTEISNLPSNFPLSSIAKPVAPASFALLPPTKPAMPIYRPMVSGLGKIGGEGKEVGEERPWMKVQQISAARAGKIANLIREAKRSIDSAGVKIDMAVENVRIADVKIKRANRLQTRADKKIKSMKRKIVGDEKTEEQKSLPSFDGIVFTHHFKSGLKNSENGEQRVEVSSEAADDTDSNEMDVEH
ncbi:uncharacterized protein RAG0_04086 [Rhynchosporium agropyri]|uniref:Uncharacterized protein n=1 Tax=Rhynchosporium agropyri TaxID=914238 RepID=A0A1E1K7J6_9HELO|nr:uncharacterized protein RAG0_04086 [Rhynchosporium agropyri]